MLVTAPDKGSDAGSILGVQSGRAGDFAREKATMQVQGSSRRQGQKQDWRWDTNNIGQARSGSPDPSLIGAPGPMGRRCEWRLHTRLVRASGP